MRRAELFPFFDALSPRGRNEFSALRTAHAAPRQQLLRRGDAANGAYLVLKGALRVYYITDEGREATLYRVEPGSTCVLALGATLTEQPYPAWVEAGSSGGSFTRVTFPVFHRSMDQEQAFRNFVLGAMSGRIFDLMRRLEEVTSSTLLQRLAAYLLRNLDAELEIAITQTQLALELGTAREVVFRALRVLTARGLVQTRRGHVRVVNARGLASEAKGAVGNASARL